LNKNIESDLYLASSETLLGYLQELDDTQSSVLLIAHNPGIAMLAGTLAANGHPDVARMRSIFPSAALAEFEFAAQRWSQIGLGSGALQQFTIPEDLSLPTR
jgi:phosphohistidine phosphatase